MPTWDEILKETEDYTLFNLIYKYLNEVSNYTKTDTICYFSGFTMTKIGIIPPQFYSITEQDIQGFMTCSNKIRKTNVNLIIHTPGGDYEATKRIINYLLNVYDKITVFVPHIALSGGTLIACASDEIIMGPYSSLGPTDPQILMGNKLIPVGAIVSEFKRAFAEVKINPETSILWSHRLSQVPLGLIDSLEAMLENSATYLKELLLRKNCKGKSEKIVEDIVEKLNDYSHHSTHGRGISLKEAKDLGLNVIDLSKDKELEDKVLSVYHAATILFQKTNVTKIIANNLKKSFLTFYNKD